MSLSPLERLRLFLRPPGRGIWIHSTGGGYAKRVLELLYGSSEEKAVQDAWEDALQRIRRVKTVILGIPSDTGASIMRGANFGPIGIREAYLSRVGAYDKDVLDIGDVICVPQLLHDEMLRDSQIAATRQALYKGKGNGLPVSPLSIAEAALYALYELNPEARVMVLGGDHSVSWPSMLYCRKRYGNEFGVLHFDAHTDMMEARLGIKYCFATWAFHAHQLMKPQHLLQVGIRTSSRNKDHWMSNYPITQLWAQEILGNEDAAIVKVLEHFKALKVKHIFITNDIDGTDSPEAPATGTPERFGLHAEFILGLIRAVRKEFHVFGGDIVEVAPPLSGIRDFGSELTCRLAAQYLSQMLKDPID